MNRPLRSSALALAACVLLGACTGSDAPGPVRSSAEQTTEASTAGPTAIPSPVESAGELALVDSDASWTVSTRVPTPFLEVLAVGDDALVSVTQDEGGTETIVLDSMGVRQEVTFGVGQITQDASVLDDGTVLYSIGDDNTGEYWVYRWDPATDSIVTAYESAGAGATWSETVVAGEYLYVTQGDGASDACLGRLDLADASSEMERVGCAPEGEYLGDLRAASDGTVVYRTYESDECGTVHRLIGDETEELDIDGCVFRAVASRDVVVWSGAAPDTGLGTNYFDAPLFALLDGQQIDLGMAAAGSAVVCDDAVYWLTYTDDPQGVTQIRRWVPGSPVEVFYRSPDEGPAHQYATSGPMCGPGIVGIQRRGWDSAMPQEFLTTPVP